MKGIRDYINGANVERFRFYVQLATFVLLIYGGWLAIDLGKYLPAFSCVYVKTRAGSCYLSPFQYQMKLKFFEFLTYKGVLFAIGLGTFLLWFALFSKAWCGFICPFGTLQDWMTRLREKMHIRYSVYSEQRFKSLATIKYFLLGLIVALMLSINNSLFGLPKLHEDFSSFYCMICPGRTILPLFTGDFNQLALNLTSKTKAGLTGLGLGITGMFLVGGFVKRRFICFFCPMSALHYIFSRIGILGLVKTGDRCTRCGNCYRVCDMEIRAIADDVTHRNILQEDCTMCLKCVGACPEEKCLEVTLLGTPIYQSTEKGFFKRMKARLHI
jgi:polyferredoxin